MFALLFEWAKLGNNLETTKLTLKDLAVRIINRTFAHYLYLWTTNKKH
jgi:hypothetical protein